MVGTNIPARHGRKRARGQSAVRGDPALFRDTLRRKSKAPNRRRQMLLFFR
jgi:hypothetical protein